MVDDYEVIFYKEQKLVLYTRKFLGHFDEIWQ